VTRVPKGWKVHARTEDERADHAQRMLVSARAGKLTLRLCMLDGPALDRVEALVREIEAG
jgi:hypothetical protein